MNRLRTPTLIVNFKNYMQAQGTRGLSLAKEIEKVAKELSVEIAVAPPAPLLMKVAEEVDIPVLAQHVDPVPASSTTGFVPPESVKEAGCVGSIINHSEHKIPHETVKEVIEAMKENNLATVVCADSEREAKDLASFSPDFIAIEPPELIGTGIPVSKAKPEVVRNGVRVVKEVNSEIAVLCGAGISSGEDVKKALELGSEGVLVASAIVKAENPYLLTKEMSLNLKL